MIRKHVKFRRLCRELGIGTPVILEMGVGSDLESWQAIPSASKVILVEPIANILDYWRGVLSKEVSFKGELVCHNVAVTDRAGLLKMRVSPRAMRGHIKGPWVGNTRISRGEEDEAPYRDWGEVTVEGVTFDTIDPGNIDFMILDIEGHELNVLLKMVSRPKLVVIEIFDVSPRRDETFKWFHDNGYRLRRQVMENYLFVHNPRPGEVPQGNL